MNLRTLILRSLRFHWRNHLGVLFGAAVGSAALIGALVVGDSVRASLREMALQRLGNIHFAMNAGDRLFRARLAELTESGVAELDDPAAQRFAISASGTIAIRSSVSNRLGKFTVTNTMQIGPGGGSFLGTTNHLINVSPVLKLSATASSQSGDARANQVHVFGVESAFGTLANSGVFSNLPSDAVVLNEALAAQLRVKPGDTVVLRTRKPGALGADSPMAPQDESSVVLRLRLHRIAAGTELGDLNLVATQVAPFNAFVALPTLRTRPTYFSVQTCSSRTCLALFVAATTLSWGNGSAIASIAWGCLSFVRRLSFGRTTFRPMRPCLALTALSISNSSYRTFNSS
jgi:hypothetical protein